MAALEIHRFTPDDTEDVRTSSRSSTPSGPPTLRGSTRGSSSASRASSARAGTVSRRSATSRPSTARPWDRRSSSTPSGTTPPRLGLDGGAPRAPPAGLRQRALRARRGRGPGRRPHQHRDGRLGVRAGGRLRGEARPGEEVAGHHAARRCRRPPGPPAGAVRRGGRAGHGLRAGPHRRTHPGRHVDAMVELVAAINDAPTDDLDIEDEVFSAERLAAYETLPDRARQPALPAGGPARGDRRARRAHGHRRGVAASRDR